MKSLLKDVKNLSELKKVSLSLIKEKEDETKKIMKKILDNSIVIKREFIDIAEIKYFLIKDNQEIDLSYIKDKSEVYSLILANAKDKEFIKSFTMEEALKLFVVFLSGFYKDIEHGYEVTYTDKLSIPICLDELFLIAQYRVDVEINVEKDEMDFQLLPISFISYNEKYNIRYYSFHRDKLYLPHNMSLVSPFDGLCRLDVSGFIEGVLSEMSSTSIRDYVLLDIDNALNEDNTKDIVEEIKNRVGLEYHGIKSGWYGKLIDDPFHYLFKGKVNQFPLDSTISTLEKPSVENGKLNLTTSNMFKYINIEEVEDIAKKRIKDSYTSLVVFSNKEFYCECGNMELDIKDVKDNFYTCSSCGDIHYISDEYSCTSLNDIKWIIHKKIGKKEKALIEKGENLDLDPLGIFDYNVPVDDNCLHTLRTVFVNTIIEGLHMSIMMKFGGGFLTPRLLFGKNESSFIDLTLNKVKICVEGEYCISNEAYSYSPESFTRYTSSEIKEYDDIYSIYCLNPEEALEIHRSIDKYNVFDEYIKLMGIEEGSYEYYASLALSEGIFANYIYTFPKLELLIKSEKEIAKTIFTKSIKKSELRRIFDFSKTKPKDIIGINKLKLDLKGLDFKDYNTLKLISNIRYLAEYSKLNLGTISYYTLDMFSIWENDLNSLRRVFKAFKDLKEELDLNVDVVDVVEYSGRAYDAQAISRDEFRDLYPDYISMANDLGYDLNNKRILFPDSLKREHDIAVRDYNVQASKFEKENFMKHLNDEDYKNLSFSDERRSIILPKDHNDLIKEGSALNHCVGSYVRKISERKSKIVFLRDNSEIDESYYTIEVIGNNVVQVRGEYNKSLKSAIDFKFLRKWSKEKGLNLNY